MSLPPNRNLLKEFKNDYFVETGSYRGDAIQQALDAGFDNIISIEIDPLQVEFCKDRFDLNNPENPLCSKIALVEGDSMSVLWDVIKDIPANKRITYWLDAHWQMLEDTEPGPNPFPLLHELRIINERKSATDTILIDDCLIFQPAIAGFGNEEIKRALYNINSFYNLKYFANPVIANILAAYPEDTIWCPNCNEYVIFKVVAYNPDDPNSMLLKQCKKCRENIDFLK